MQSVSQGEYCSCLTKGCKVHIVFLLLRIYEQLQTTHTLCTKPFSKTSSSVKSSQSAERSVRMSCEQTASVRRLCRASGLMLCAQHCHRDIIKLTPKFVSNKTQPTINHNPSKHTQWSQF